MVGQGAQHTLESPFSSGGSLSLGTMASRHVESTSASSPMIALIEITQCSGKSSTQFLNILTRSSLQCCALLWIRLSSIRPALASTEGGGLGRVPRGESKEQSNLFSCFAHRALQPHRHLQEVKLNAPHHSIP